MPDRNDNKEDKKPLTDRAIGVQFFSYALLLALQRLNGLPL